MYEILGLKHVFSTFQETVWSHLKSQNGDLVHFFRFLAQRARLELIDLACHRAWWFLGLQLYDSFICSLHFVGYGKPTLDYPDHSYSRTNISYWRTCKPKMFLLYTLYVFYIIFIFKANMFWWRQFWEGSGALFPRTSLIFHSWLIKVQKMKNWYQRVSWIYGDIFHFHWIETKNYARHQHCRDDIPARRDRF